jgi:hypothetical protein
MQAKRPTRHPLNSNPRQTRSLCRPWKGVQRKSSQARDAGKIFIQTEENCAVFESNCGNQSIYGRQTDAFRPSQAQNRGGLPVRRQSARLDHFPQGKITLQAMDVPSEPLEDLRHDDAGEREGLGLLDHAPQFSAGGAGSGSKKIDPHGGVDQDQERFRRMRFRSPFQTPLP